MRKVVIIGAGQTKFGERWEKSLKDLMAEAGTKAVMDSEITGDEIDALYTGCMASGRLIGQEHIGALVADQVGLNPIPSTRVEAACASGGTALRTAYLSIKSGEHDTVVAGGGEKMVDVLTGRVNYALGGAGDQETEVFNGATFAALYGLMARKHMEKYGTTEEQLGKVAVKNHENGAKNPKAQYQREISLEAVMNSTEIASPLKLFDCSPITDGAASVVLTTREKAEEMGKEYVEIAGSGQASDTLDLANRKSITKIKATEVASQIAYKEAGVNSEEIDFAEVHDCFTIAEIMAMEDLGFYEKGEAAKAVERGETRLRGKIPINPSGGLKSKGHPVGATGIAQAVENYKQLTGKAGERQIENPEIGLSHNVGGTGATAVVHIFKKPQEERR
ncbi:MAG: thiolase domain-containing protein [archaeon]